MKRATFAFVPYQVQNYISIHALVKRATDMGFGGSYNSDISIHALVKRATRQFLSQKKKSRYFNPRPREEGDLSADTLM